MAENNVPFVTLNNGVTMPQLGLGVWQAEPEDTEHAVGAALAAGYRLIDTAAMYKNEADVGRAIADSGIPREDIFVTTKLWTDDQGAERTRPAFEASLERLGLDYVDLYLIHWPAPSKGLAVETWHELEKIHNEKKARAIGVSNFRIEDLEELAARSDTTPAVNQIELHPKFSQPELRTYGREHGIQIESWSPIGGSKSNLLEDETLIGIGEQYNKSPAQIAIRWHIQHGLVVIPKSVHKERINQNFDVFDFELSENDMAAIDSLENGVRVGPDPNEMS